MSEKPVYRMVFTRPQNSITGTLTVFRDEKEFIKTKALSGQKGFEGTQWQRGKSPIPQFENGFLWCDYAHQIGQLDPKGKEIGEAWNISTSAKDRSAVYGKTKDHVRLAIMLHPDNAYPGSAGCIVLPNTQAGRAAYRTIRTLLLDLQKQGIKTIRLDSRIG